ncbi:unnamed protein product [Linum trigynum]|uniref:Uncharacterized protein n=1 Tax=Linum trigynum TaxID=586398 RepID=A0AAV2DME3_9ROSI
MAAEDEGNPIGKLRSFSPMASGFGGDVDILRDGCLMMGHMAEEEEEENSGMERDGWVVDGGWWGVWEDSGGKTRGEEESTLMGLGIGK